MFVCKKAVGWHKQSVIIVRINASKLDEKSWNRFQDTANYLLKRFRKYSTHDTE
jgi:hypothetical protein